MKRSIFLLIFAVLSLYSYSQNFTGNLPKTWEYRSGIGVFYYTINENGSITTQMINNCFVCYGVGTCPICGGTGTRFIYGGINRCNYCFGTGKCKNCQGKGHKVVYSNTEYGQTIIVDEDGNAYVTAPSNIKDDNDRYSSTRQKKPKRYIDKLEYVTGFDLSTVYCPQCGRIMQRHVHVRKYY